MTAPAQLAGRRVTVVGLGRFGGGLGATRWLCSQGAKVTVSDKADADELAGAVSQLQDMDVTLHLGGHDERDFIEADLLVVNPAIPKEMPLLISAAAMGVERTSEINLFLERCPTSVVGITGTVGKSTTTAMIGQVLSTEKCVHVGGNIGISLLEKLQQIQPDDIVVLELSSFQLEDLPIIGISPHIALVTNIAPNHLDRHGTIENYAEAKKNIFRFQSAGDVLILNSTCGALANWPEDAPGWVEYFDPRAEPFELTMPGAHNQANAQAAWAVARQFDIERGNATEALRDFGALPHRLQFVCETGGVKYYNDSKCTTPEGAIVAMEAFDARTAVIIVGGYDKGVSFDALGAALAARAKTVIALGDTRRKIIEAVEKHRNEDAPVVCEAGSLAEAVTLAKGETAEGDTILLSPACASYDIFKNYEQRGDAFAELVT